MQNSTTRVLFLIAIVASSALSGCLGSLRPDAPQSIHYYSAAPDAHVDGGSTLDLSGTLRLGRVRAADHLTNRMVWRVSDVEYGFYELARWTEAPREYLERTLSKTLFQTRGIPESLGPEAHVLDAKLVGFEEDLSDGRHARVAVAFHLQRGGAVLWTATLESLVPIASNDRAQAAAAIRGALTDVVARASEIIIGRLE